LTDWSDFLGMHMLKRREKALVDKIRQAGLLTEGEQLNAPFRFMIRPFTTAGTDYRKIASRFEHEAFQLVKLEKFGSVATNIIVFPKILDRSIAVEPDHIAYKKKERAVYVAVNIDHATWQNASDDQRIDLISDNIMESIIRIPQKYFTESDRKKLLGIVDKTRRQVKAKLLH
jgi:hypothetical protein